MKQTNQFLQHELQKTNPLIHNQRYVGAWVKKRNDYDCLAFKVINVTGKYFYGFTQSGQPRIVDVSKYPVFEVFFDECDYCLQLTPVKELTNAYINWQDDKKALCKECAPAFYNWEFY